MFIQIGLKLEIIFLGFARHVEVSFQEFLLLDTQQRNSVGHGVQAISMVQIKFLKKDIVVMSEYLHWIKTPELDGEEPMI